MPSVFTQTLGKATIFLFTGKRLRRVHLLRHSAKFETLPSASVAALGKARNFAECCQVGTRRNLNFCRVPRVCHSAKFSTPSRSAVPFVPFACSSVPFQLFLPSAAWHTAKVCRVPEKMHSAKPASPVEERPCAFRRVLHFLPRFLSFFEYVKKMSEANFFPRFLPSVFRPLPSVARVR